MGIDGQGNFKNCPSIRQNQICKIPLDCCELLLLTDYESGINGIFDVTAPTSRGVILYRLPDLGQSRGSVQHRCCSGRFSVSLYNLSVGQMFALRGA